MSFLGAISQSFSSFSFSVYKNRETAVMAGFRFFAFKAIHNAKNTSINWVVIEMRASACSFFVCGIKVWKFYGAFRFGIELYGVKMEV